MPGQFKHLAPYIAGGKNRVVFLTQRNDVRIPGVETVTYAVPRQAAAGTHHYVRTLENSVLAGQEVVRKLQELRRAGFTPDVVIAHSGWGEALFLKDLYPKVPLIVFSEFYYRPQELRFEPQQEVTLDQVCRLRARNATLLLSLEACDVAITPTHWQKQVQPAAFHNKISVVFDGIDTDLVKPNSTARFMLPNGRTLTGDDEIVTYVARNLEPYRGFPSFIRALPTLLALRPTAEVVVVGGDNVSYGAKPECGKTWRDVMLNEVDFDRSRVHFIPRLGYAHYLSLLQISSAHVYLTHPFVLSWSFMEAMATGCLLICSSTSPVEEVVVNGFNGLFVNFHAAEDIARTIASALSSKSSFGTVRMNARSTVESRYKLSNCLEQQRRIIQDIIKK